MTRLQEWDLAFFLFRKFYSNSRQRISSYRVPNEMANPYII